MPGKCTYNPAWETHAEFGEWIKPSKEQGKAYCIRCQRSFDISNMGVAAVKSHGGSVKHAGSLKQTDQTPPISMFMQYSGAQAHPDHVDDSADIPKEQLTVPPPPAQKVPSTSTTGHGRGMDKYLIQQETLKAEIYWALETVVSHNSFNSNQTKPQLFQAMFPDSDIARQYSMKATKCSYLITHGIAPYIERKLQNQIQKSSTM